MSIDERKTIFLWVCACWMLSVINVLPTEDDENKIMINWVIMGMSDYVRVNRHSRALVYCSDRENSSYQEYLGESCPRDK